MQFTLTIELKGALSDRTGVIAEALRILAAKLDTWSALELATIRGPVSIDGQNCGKWEVR